LLKHYFYGPWLKELIQFRS